MKNSKFFKAKLILALAFVASLFFTGCQQNADTGTINGTWVASEYETYIVNTEEKTFSNLYYDGKNLEISYTDDSCTVGYLYFIYIKAYMVSESGDWSYSESAPDVGKWYAVSFKDLTSNSVKISGAYKTNGKTSTETLEEAKTEFTVENGYFAWYSECVKQ